jgi:ribosomal protein S18 acetylase RimI-like enzyme
MLDRLDHIATARANGTITIGVAAPDDMTAVRELFREYAGWLQADICLSGFERELAELPGAYAAPRGCLLLAHDGTRAAGVVALRPRENDICEMKRLYVRPQARGRGLGRQLVVALLDAARNAGYRSMTLETLERMSEARRLYASLGFTEIAAADRRPSDHPIAMEIAL